MASIQTPQRTVDNVRIDIGSVPGAVAQLLVPRLHDQLTAAIGNQLARIVPPRVAQFFNDFLSH